MEKSKKCTRCKKVKKLNVKNFPPHNKVKCGFDSWCRICRNEYKRNNRYKKYNLSEKEFKALNKVKKCPICKKNKPSVIDHCHKSSKVRGIICQNCNLGLGHFKDNKKILVNAINYLEES